MIGKRVRASLRGICLVWLLTGGWCGLWLLIDDDLTHLGRAWSSGGAAGLIDLPFPQLLTGLCACLVLLGVTWLSGTTSLVVLLMLVQPVTRAAPRPKQERLLRFCPQLAQRLALAFCGVALSSVGVGSGPGSMLAGSPAVADGGSDLGGLVVPDRVSGRSWHATTVRVVGGDSLWSICAGLLPAGAAELDITAAWRELYRSNRAAIGPDPDLIFPGTTLQVPQLTDHEGRQQP